MKNNNKKTKKYTLITKFAEENNCTKYEAAHWIRAVNKAMVSLLMSNNRVYLKDLLTIRCVKAKSRDLTHRVTKEKIFLPERMKPKAFFCKKIKNVIKENLKIESVGDKK